MPTITGSDRHLRRLKRARSNEAIAAVDDALLDGARLIRVTAQIKITEGSISGKGHIPSLPGQPPNADTHTLANGITEKKIGPLNTQVQAVAMSEGGYNYAVIERGNSRVAERPYLRPSAAEKRREIARNVLKAVDTVIRRGT